MSVSASDAIRVAAGGVLAAGVAIPESHRWISTVAHHALVATANAVGETWPAMREQLAQDLAETIGALPEVSDRDARHVARGFVALAGIVRGWLA